MKYFAALLLLLFSASQGMADGYFDFPEITANGYYAAPTVRWTQINAEDTVLVGGRAGWVMNHMYSIGLAGCMSVIDVPATDVADNQYSRNLDTRFGYGGLDIQYIDKYQEAIHYTMGIVAGLGKVSYVDPDDDGFDKNDMIFVFEPKARGIYNLTSWCQIGFGVSYRFIQGLEMWGMTQYDLSGMALSGEIVFGVF